MNSRHQMWRLMFTFVLFNGMNTAASAAVPTKLIVGTQSCLQMQTWDGVTQYTLELAVFKGRQQALAYRKLIGRSVNVPVYVSYLVGSDTYAVATGPINGLNTLHRICRQVLAGAKSASQSTCVSCGNKTSGIVRPVAKPLPNLWSALPFFVPATKSSSTKTVAVHQNVGTQSAATQQKTKHLLLAHSKNERTTMKAKNRFEHTGPYVGASTGPLLNTSGVPSTYGAWQGEIFLGYGADISSWFYLGAEVFGLNSIQIRNVYPVLKPANARTGWSYGASVMPGVRINKHDLLYLRLGGADTDFFGSVDGYGSYSRAAWQIGIGGQDKLTKNLALRLEYVFSKYVHKDFPAARGVPEQTNVYGDQFSAGLVYRFNE